MKNLLSIGLISTSFFLTACTADKNNLENGDHYVGVWVNPKGQQSKSETDVIVNDRIIIEKTATENTYAATILAKGVFSQMTFNPENGLLCSSNEACFQFKDGKLRLGGEEGVLTYEKENSNENK